jgi:hypothetical protein
MSKSNSTFQIPAAGKGLVPTKAHDFITSQKPLKISSINKTKITVSNGEAEPESSTVPEQRDEFYIPAAGERKRTFLSSLDGDGHLPMRTSSLTGRGPSTNYPVRTSSLCPRAIRYPRKVYMMPGARVDTSESFEVIGRPSITPPRNDLPTVGAIDYMFDDGESSSSSERYSDRAWSHETLPQILHRSLSLLVKDGQGMTQSDEVKRTQGKREKVKNFVRKVVGLKKRDALKAHEPRTKEELEADGYRGLFDK